LASSSLSGESSASAGTLPGSIPFKSLDRLPIQVPRERLRATFSEHASGHAKTPVATEMARPFPPRAYINRPSQTGNKEIFAQTSGLAVFSRRVAKKTLLRNTFPPQVLAGVPHIEWSE
jgi:hypothetical protein